MYKTFQKWYKVGTALAATRKVIKYQDKRPELINPNAVKEGRHKTKFVRSAHEGFVCELELSKLFFLGLRIRDDGEFPQIPPPPGLFQRILGGEDKRPVPSFTELYISRYLLPR